MKSVGAGFPASFRPSLSRRRFVSHDALPAEAPLFAFPYDPEADRLARVAVAAMHGPSRFRRFLSVLRLTRQPRFRARAPWRSILLKRRRG